LYWEAVAAPNLSRVNFEVRENHETRRQFLHLSAGAAALPALSRIARGQTYPARPVRIVVGFAAGGFTDIAARLMGQWLSERLGQPFVIENRTGAAGNIATEAVVRAAPDGYTLLIALDATAINATLYDKLNFNFISDIAPVAGIARAPFVMAVNPSFPATTVPEFIAPRPLHDLPMSALPGASRPDDDSPASRFQCSPDRDTLHYQREDQECDGGSSSRGLAGWWRGRSRREPSSLSPCGGSAC
jgi:hypothetical protein